MFPLTTAFMLWSRAGAGRPGTTPSWQGPRHRRHLTPKLADLEDRLLLSAGDLDLSFNPSSTQPGIIAFDLGGKNFDYASSVAIHQPDGKIVVAGSTYISYLNYDFAVARLNSNGTLDTSFNRFGSTPGTCTINFDRGDANGNDDFASSVAIQPDPHDPMGFKIVVAGSVQRPGTYDFDFGVARLNSDGTLDTSFNRFGSTPGKRTINFVVDRYNQPSQDIASSVAIQPAPASEDPMGFKIVVAGRTQTLNPILHTLSGQAFGVARLNSDGTPDTSFNSTVSPGTCTIDFDPSNSSDMGDSADQTVGLEFGMAFQPDPNDPMRSKIVVVSGLLHSPPDNWDFAVARVNYNGTPDTSFNSTGSRPGWSTIAFDLGDENKDIASSVAIQPGGKIVVAGSAQISGLNFDFAVARLNSDGTPDTSFNRFGSMPGTCTIAFDLGNKSDRAYGVAIQPDPHDPMGFKIVVAGGVSSPDSDNLDFGVVRLKSDGTLDTNFGTNGRVTTPADLRPGAADWAPPMGLAIQSDGKIVVAGGDPGPDISNEVKDWIVVRYQGVAQKASGDFNGDGKADIVTGAGPGGGPHVQVFSGADGSVLRSFMAYDPRFTGGIFVATADINGDGVPDIITGAGPGGGPHVQVFSGADGSVLRSFMAYDPRFTGGIFVATGDVNGDGVPDIITGAGPGGGPHVQVFSGVDGSVLRSFMAYDPRFTGGIFVATGDINGDGKADIITGAGPGGGPHVQVFSGVDGSVLRSFMAYDPRFTGGIFVSTGDINGDGTPDIITGAGPGGGPHVQVFSGADGSVLRSFMAYDPRFTGGIFVASGDINGDGRADIVTGAGRGGGPHVQVFSGTDSSVLRSFMAYDPRFTGGIFVASGGGGVGATGTSSSIVAGGLSVPTATETGVTLTTGSGPGQSVPACPGNAFANSARAQAKRSPGQGDAAADSSPRVVPAWRSNSVVPRSGTSPSGWDSLAGALLPDVTTPTLSLAPGTRKTSNGRNSLP